MSKLLPILLFPLFAFADPTLRIVHVGGLHSVTPTELEDIYHCASPYFKKVGITFRVKIFPLDYNPCIYSHNLAVQVEEFKCLSIFASSRRRVITYVMTPPFLTVDSYGGPLTGWLAGIAKVCGNISTGSAEAFSLVDDVFGRPMLQHSATVLAHEVFHNMCATHFDESENLMHSNANIFTTKYGCNLPIVRQTKRQVKRWYAQTRKKD